MTLSTKETLARWFAAPAIALALGAVSPQAKAQDFPSIQPRRPATVTYQLNSTQTGPMQVQAFVSPELQMMRLQEGQGGDYLLLDRGHERIMLVSPGKHLVFAVSSNGFLHRDLGPGSNLRFQPRGQRQVAGHGCMDWSVEGPGGQGEACITRDGILLAGSGQGNKPDDQGQIQSGRLTAISVNYDPVPPDAFAIPPGLQEVDLPPSLLASMIPGLSGIPIQ
ncbi:hypothetical protein ACELLULO517_04055 [Acidisoma cellulosilytica]|uniref:DUF4412 domain-containing protein n=1 Tax=Acidisoma cellulosilyticum TaxID=2802395 RepID=A0A963YYA0_9PROT|nr:hypothetical protein [Acidisoma cellulosilyticum]MCB8879394.1 hypothetical protein [Acidisoma cellulosilyticum]